MPDKHDNDPDEPLFGVAGTYPLPDCGVTEKSAPATTIAGVQMYAANPPDATVALEWDGYGTDPNLVNPVSPWARTLTLFERKMIEVLADLLLPATSTAPSPSHTGIADFFDDWLSAPYGRQQTDNARILDGLKSLNGLATETHQDDFIHLTADQQRSVLDKMIVASDEGQTFFLRFRYLVVGGYFTSDVGMRELGYRGNIPLKKPATVPDNVLAIIDAELQKLGL